MKDIVKILESKKQDLKKEYEAKLKAMDYTIGILQGKNIETPTDLGVDLSTFKPTRRRRRGKSTIALVKEIIQQKGRFIHNKEITDDLMVDEPEEDRDKVARQVSQVLSNLKRAGELVTYRLDQSNKNMFWGYKDWQDSKGNVKPDYAPKTNK